MADQTVGVPVGTGGRPFMRSTRHPGLTDQAFHYCPGCTHGIIHHLLADVLVERGLVERTIGIASVGCSYNSYDYFACDMVQAAHGRAPAVAGAIKRTREDAILFTYQGDGDLAAIGMAEIVHAAARGEPITVIFVNNAIYGMTNGQLAPTTLLGQSSATTPAGRSSGHDGWPIGVCEMLATLPGAVFLERVSLDGVRGTHQAKRAMHRAFEVQEKKQGFALVELLATCPTNWRMTAAEALAWVAEHMKPVYPCRVFREPGDRDDMPQAAAPLDPSVAAPPRVAPKASAETVDEEALSALAAQLPDRSAEHSWRDEGFAVIFAGFGGQGVLSTGQLLAEAAMEEGAAVSWFPSYGPEMRGGTANCQVVLAPEQVTSPIIERADALLAMNEASLLAFVSRVRDGGLILVDGTVVNEAVIARAHERREAEGLGPVRIVAQDASDRLRQDKIAALPLLWLFGVLNGLELGLSAARLRAALEETLPKRHHRLIPRELEVLIEAAALAETLGD